jgi:Spy/CpxP family protein refolding chaperone
MVPATQPAPEAMLKMFDRVAIMLTKQLNMTDEQKTKFQAIVKTNRAELQEIIKRLEAQRQTFDKQLNAILTPEQKQKLQQMRERRERMMRRMGQGEAGPGILMKAVKELNLPADRAAQVNTILTDAKAKFKEAKGDRDARRTIMKNMMDKLNKVLTGEEMDKLRDLVRDQMGPRGMGPRGMGPRGEGRHGMMRRGPGPEGDQTQE